MKQEPATRVLVADDHYVVRMGVAAIINNEPDLELVAEAANGLQAVELFTRLKPDLALLDSRMPLMDGVQAAREIRRLCPAARLLMLTAFDGDEDVLRAMEAGVQGYLVKSSTGEHLVPAIRAVAAGQRWIPVEPRQRLALRATLDPPAPPDPPHPSSP